MPKLHPQHTRAALVLAFAFAGCQDTPRPFEIPTVTVSETSTAPAQAEPGAASVPSGSSTAPNTSPSSVVPGSSSQGGMNTFSTASGPSGVETSASQSSASTHTSASSSTSASMGTTSMESTSSSSTTSTSGEPTDTTEPKKRRRWTSGHGDIRISWSKKSQSLVAKIEISRKAVVDGIRLDKTIFLEPDEVEVVVAKTEVYKNVGKGREIPCINLGDTMYFLSMSPEYDPPTPHFGFANRISRKSPVKDRRAAFVFTDFSGNAEDQHFIAWTYLAGKSAIKGASCDGLEEKDQISMRYGHGHYNLGFTGAAGRRTLQITGKAELKDGTKVQTVFPVHFDLVK